jgi:hypothetical protein
MKYLDAYSEEELDYYNQQQSVAINNIITNCRWPVMRPRQFWQDQDQGINSQDCGSFSKTKTVDQKFYAKFLSRHVQNLSAK